MNIEVNDIVKTFKNHCVLDHVSFAMEKGYLHCLLGASGSGKTTLLKIIMGASKPDSGTVLIDKRKVPDKSLLLNIGFMPQQDGLYDELSIYDNLKFFAGIQRIKGNHFRTKAEELIDVVGLRGEEKKLVMNCSGGMKKRVSLAVALIHSPELVILDEPTVGIDPVLRRQIWNYLKKLRNEGKTIVVTTHVMDEVSQCDYAALLRNGKILIKDSIENLNKLTGSGTIEDLFFTEQRNGKEGNRDELNYC